MRWWLGRCVVVVAMHEGRVELGQQLILELVVCEAGGRWRFRAARAVDEHLLSRPASNHNGNPNKPKHPRVQSAMHEC